MRKSATMNRFLWQPRQHIPDDWEPGYSGGSTPWEAVPYETCNDRGVESCCRHPVQLTANRLAEVRWGNCRHRFVFDSDSSRRASEPSAHQTW